MHAPPLPGHFPHIQASRLSVVERLDVVHFPAAGSKHAHYAVMLIVTKEHPLAPVEWEAALGCRSQRLSMSTLSTIFRTLKKASDPCFGSSHFHVARRSVQDLSISIVRSSFLTIPQPSPSLEPERHCRCALAGCENASTCSSARTGGEVIWLLVLDTNVSCAGPRAIFRYLTTIYLMYYMRSDRL